MSGKLKGLLAVLSLGALVLPAYLFGWFRSDGHVADLADPGYLKAQSLGFVEPSKDTDQDGLTDDEEVYWRTDFKNKDSDGDGFIDGEEVLSGHDPAKPGPNDWLDRSKNVTQKMTDLMVGGVYAGDLKPGTENYDASVQRLAEIVAEQYRQNIAVKVDDITLTPTDTLKDRSDYLFQTPWTVWAAMYEATRDAQKFLSTVSDVPLDDASPLTDDAKRYAAFSTVARTLARANGERAAKLAAIPVPLSFAHQHKGAIGILRNLQRQYEIAATLKNDPIQGLVAIRSIVNLHTNVMPSYLGDFARKVEMVFADEQ